MNTTDLQGVARHVTRRAQRQGFIIARDVREELAEAGQPEALWKDVLALARPSLHYRGGRYYYAPPVSARVQAEQSHQREVAHAVRALIDRYRSAARVERREHGRVDFVQPVQVTAEDGREMTLLSRDLSPTGIRLIGTRRLLGQKVRVRVSCPDGPPWDFLVRVLWACPVGDDLVENGGTFLTVERLEK
jgi:hypothetical protein